MIIDRVYNEIHRDLVFFLGDIRDDVDVAEAFARAEAFIHVVGVLGAAEAISNPRASSAY